MSSQAEDPPVDKDHPGLDATRPEEDPSKDRRSGDNCGWGGSSWSPTKAPPKNKEAAASIGAGTPVVCRRVAAAGAGFPALAFGASHGEGRE